MSLTINDILKGNQEEFYRLLMDTISNNIRVALPGIIQSFDSSTQTATVQPAIREHIRYPDLSSKWVQIPLLVDVPVQFPRAGGFTMTFPVQPNDECLVVFGDMCMDGWFANGGVQNQPDKRRHDLSDGYALLGFYSQPRKLSGFNTSALQLRSDDGTVSISLSSSGIAMTAPTNSITANGKVIG